jgi:hypothetical protein
VASKAPDQNSTKPAYFPRLEGRLLAEANVFAIIASGVQGLILAGIPLERGQKLAQHGIACRSGCRVGAAIAAGGTGIRAGGVKAVMMLVVRARGLSQVLHVEKLPVLRGCGEVVS